MRPLSRYASVLLLAALGACTSIERAAIPSAEITDRAWEAHSPGATATIDHGAWSAFLGRYLSVGGDGIARLSYGAVSAEDRSLLKAYLADLENADVAALDRPEQLAFWINLYNAKTVDLVLEAYPTDSIRSVRGGVLKTGPWGEKVIEVAGRPLSLNDIEHAIARPIWRDPRVHYAFNCAALSCPNLIAEAYTGATIEALLEANATAYVNDPRGFRFEGETLTASKIYTWFEEDFGEGPKDVLNHAAQYAEPDLAERLRAAESISAYEYDWGLNDAEAVPSS